MTLVPMGLSVQKASANSCAAGTPARAESRLIINTLSSSLDNMVSILRINGEDASMNIPFHCCVINFQLCVTQILTKIHTVTVFESLVV